jgi:hypothetical protein
VDIEPLPAAVLGVEAQRRAIDRVRDSGQVETEVRICDGAGPVDAQTVVVAVVAVRMRFSNDGIGVGHDRLRGRRTSDAKQRGQQCERTEGEREEDEREP